MQQLTVKEVEARKPKDKPYKFSIDRGLQMRVAPDGVRTLLVRYSVKGSEGIRQFTLPNEYGEGPGKIRLAEARAEASRIRALARSGIDWAEQEASRLNAQKQAEAAAAAETKVPTFADALQEYVEKKRRAKDGLPLKPRTKADYLGMFSPGKVLKSGERTAAGELFPIAGKRLSEITADDIRAVYDSTLPRSQRRATYAMQVVRALLRWYGVVVADNPLGRDTAGRERIILAAPPGKPSPIPYKLIGAWWRASCRVSSKVAGSYYQFQLLTGCRGVEIHGEKRFGYPPIRVGDVDQMLGTIILRDTKNRRDHKLYLSRQALDIVEFHCKGKDRDAPLFDIVNPRKTLDVINAEAGTQVRGHGLRATFASVAESLVSSAVLKYMMNHSITNDVTLNHYVTKSEDELRAGWQAVANFIENAAKG